MKMRKKAAVIGLLILCSFFLGTVGVQAKTTKTEINYVYTMHVSGDAERMWASDGVYHIRNSPHDGHVISSESDFTGTLKYLGNLNLFDDLLNPTSFNSVGWGPLEFEGLYEEEPVGFAGKLNLKINDFYITGTFVCHGTKGFEGMLIKGTFEGWLSLAEYDTQIVIH